MDRYRELQPDKRSHVTVPRRIGNQTKRPALTGHVPMDSLFELPLLDLLLWMMRTAAEGQTSDLPSGQRNGLDFAPGE